MRCATAIHPSGHLHAFRPGTGLTYFRAERPVSDELPAVRASRFFEVATAAHGRVAPVLSSICSPNTGHSTRSPGAPPAKIETQPRPAGCGREYELSIAPESGPTKPIAQANVQPGRRSLNFGLFRDLQRVIYLDSKVSDGALQLGMAEQDLHGPQVLRALIDQRCLSSPHRVRAIDRRIEADGGNPLMDDPGVLSR